MQMCRRKVCCSKVGRDICRSLSCGAGIGVVMRECRNEVVPRELLTHASLTDHHTLVPGSDR